MFTACTAPKRFLGITHIILAAIVMVGCGGGGGSSQISAGNTANSGGNASSGGGNSGGAVIPTGSFSLSWTAPMTRQDGTPMSLAEIDGYRVYYGDTPGNYPNIVDINDGSVNSTTVSNVPVGDYYIVMTTYDSDGRESTQSSAVFKQAI